MDLIMNCRQSYQALARKYEITLNAIKKRIQKMLAEGVFEFRVEPHVAMIDGNWAIAFITTTGEEVLRPAGARRKLAPRTARS